VRPFCTFSLRAQFGYAEYIGNLANPGDVVHHRVGEVAQVAGVGLSGARIVFTVIRDYYFGTKICC
jgi:hypothetical protein